MALQTLSINPGSPKLDGNQLDWENSKILRIQAIYIKTALCKIGITVQSLQHREIK